MVSLRSAMAFLLVGCGSQETVEEVQSETVVSVPSMDASALLVRASMDLRGVRPSVGELRAVENDPVALEAMIESYLYDDRFEGRVRSLFNEVFLTRQDSFDVTSSMVGMEDEPTWAESVGDEPLRILGHIAANDLPYTDLVTANWTMANETLAEAWPLDYPEGETGWQQSTYNDDRPMAGILTTNSMWWRYMSTTSNANRGRANAVSKILLCTDYLSKPITFSRDVNLLDEEALADALRSNPGCVACHNSLDPLASYFWGFYYQDYDSPIDTRSYHPEREWWWEDYSGVQPGYYGEPGYTLEDLGEQLADDPGLVDCAVEHVWELLLQRDIVLEDTEPLWEHRQAFVAGGLTLRPLILSVVASPEYRSGITDDPRYAARKLVSPDQLATQMEDLTGYRFTYEGYDMLQTDTYGLRTLAGGVDGSFVTVPASEPITTMVLVVERLAQAAAWYAVEHDAERPEDEQLFTEVNLSATPAVDLEGVIAQIQLLHLRIFGTRVEAEGPEVEANLELWNELYALDLNGESAWAGLLSVLLRDPDILFY